MYVAKQHTNFKPDPDVHITVIFKIRYQYFQNSYQYTKAK